MVKARQADCARLAQQIALDPLLASKPGLLSYVEALCLLTSGIWAWCSQTARYAGGQREALGTSPSHSMSRAAHQAHAAAALPAPTKPSSPLKLTSPFHAGAKLASPPSRRPPNPTSFVVTPFPRREFKAPCYSRVPYIGGARPFTSSCDLLSISGRHAISFA